MNPALLLLESQKINEELVEIRRAIHRHAETGFEVSWTKAYVKKKLIEYGYQPKECGKAGLTALAGRGEGKVFLIRAEMDALRIKEETALSYASENGNMHACGHDLHAAMLLGAAKLLKQFENEIEGTVKFMFEPAEEILGGALDMIQNGVLESPRVDAAMMIHVVSSVSLEPGTIILPSPGVSIPGASMFKVIIHGKGCHGSMPETGIDPISAAIAVMNGIEMIRARELSMKERAMLTFGMIQAGTAPNIIPDSVVIQGSLRAFDEKIICTMKQRVKEIVLGIVESYRCNAEVEFNNECPPLINDSKMSHSFEGYCRALLNDKVIFSEEMNGSSGSEDFSFVTQQVPSIMLAMAAGKPEDGYCYPQHHPKVVFDETVLPYGTALFTYASMQWLKENKER